MLVPTNPANERSFTDTPNLPITRIGLHPLLDSLQFLLQVSGYLPVVEKEDKEPFPLADAVPQLIGSEDVLRAHIGLAHVPVKEP